MSAEPQEFSQQSHVGAYIRANIIPVGMSVKDAARLLGVGRPAFSNLVNGKAALSPEMALRLQQTFGADRDALMKSQAKVDGEQRKEAERAVAVRTYVPNFITLKARDIHGWPDGNLDARSHLPVLLRRLVHSTGRDLLAVDFPGFDNAQRTGWDGWVEAGASTAWIPDGKSGWEVGTDADPKQKAESDYKNRVTAVPKDERREITLVIATNRNWPGRKDWARQKNAKREWKAVRAFDASDLEQWLEESIPAQMWLAEQLGRPVSGYETLEHAWDRWVSATEPPLAAEIFESTLVRQRDKLRDWLNKSPDRALVVSSDSSLESMAFLACLFRDPEIAARWRDLAVVFNEAEPLRILGYSSSPFIPIVHSDDVEQELAPIYRRFHSIVIRPRNAVNSEPDITVGYLSHEAFATGLAAMQITGGEAERLERASGRSPTILRRQLGTIPSVKTPHWADGETARRLLPISLVGAWHVRSAADCQVLASLAGCAYDEVEQNVARLRQGDDPPVWSVDQYRGVVSKVDSLFAIAPYVTRSALQTFFKVAADVLAEFDPALELPEGQRWAAGVYGKVRNHSAALRRGICETLVIMAVHGNNQFQKTTGVDASVEVSLLIRRLLSPLTLEKLLSYDSDLPNFAEAAPSEFLALLETDLASRDPVVHGLLKPVAGGAFSHPSRTGLLWALENLAWKHLGRVVPILAQLSRIEINDNWVNKPINTLLSIYRPWMPQTAASLEERMQSLELLTCRYKDIGWRVCMDELDLHSRVGHYNHKPQWRSDAFGAGEPMPDRRPDLQFRLKAFELACAWQGHNEKALGDLVERLDAIDPDMHAQVWDLVDSWAATSADEMAKGQLRERIRRFAFTRRARRRGKARATDRARSAYDRLSPRDPVIRNLWLFAKHWVEESAGEIDDELLDFSKRAERIHQQRMAALVEIYAAKGAPGAFALLPHSEAPQLVGQYAAPCMRTPEEAADVVRAALGASEQEPRRVDGFLQGLLGSVDSAMRAKVITDLANDSDAVTIRVFCSAPFGSETWRLLDQFGPAVRDRYWSEVQAVWGRHSEEELNEIVDRLLEATRPQTAFFAVHMDWDKVETSRLKRLLLAVATVSSEKDGRYRLEQHDISEAFEALHGRAGVTQSELAQLEFLYIHALERTDHGIPNLEQQVSETPAMFVQAVALAFKRSDGGEDLPSEVSTDPESRSHLATAAYRLLDNVSRIPGGDGVGLIDGEKLAAWVRDVRRMCAEAGRLEVGDQMIGRLLSRSPHTDKLWPDAAVCEVMQSVASEHLGRGFAMGVYNARGVHWRGDGGDQERELAEKFRLHAAERAIEYPYVSGVLEGIASSYDREAAREDSESKVRQRLGG